MKHEISNSDIDNLMVTALEGGINYWCRKVRIIKFPDGVDELVASDAISLGGELKLWDAESDDTWVLTRDKFLSGLEKAIEWSECDSVEEFMDNQDAEYADVLIQYALFNEIVFG